MAKRLLGMNLKQSESYETWAIGGTGADTVNDNDIGKAVTLDLTVPGGAMKLAGLGDPIDGFIISLEINEPTHNGRVVGTISRDAKGTRQYVTSAAALVVGDKIIGAAQAAAKTHEALFHFAKSANYNANNYNIPVVGKGAGTWRVIEVTDLANKIYLVEAV